ncbi:AbgT family transporter [Vibrio lentus]|nr:AbgT family transporter [Vibrio lentus]
MGLSSVLIVAIGWYVTEKVIEPRLANTLPLDEHEQAPDSGTFTAIESKAFKFAGWQWLRVLARLFAWFLENSAPVCLEGEPTVFSAPVMKLHRSSDLHPVYYSGYRLRP